MGLAFRIILIALAALALLASPPPALAAGDRDKTSASKPDRPQIAAATADAIANLRANIGREELTRHLTVDEFLSRTEASDEALLKTLQSSEIVGGPRWLDQQTCEVQLKINGARIGKTLLVIASSNPRTSPIAADHLAQVVAGWDRRTFSGSGSSTSARPIELRPRAGNTSWADVADDARQRALAAARADAVERVLGSVRSLELADHQLVGDALLIPEVKQRMTTWLSSRPVTRVEFGRDMQVELALSATPEDAFAEFRAAVASTAMGKALALPSTDTEWSHLRRQWVRRMALPDGVAVLAANAVHPATRTAIPSRHPDWVGGALIAEGGAPAEHNKLMSARAAENAARANLMSQVDGLPLTPDLTVGQAAGRNTRLREAISRLVADAPISRTLYGSMGRQTTIKVELDSNDLWDAIQEN